MDEKGQKGKKVGADGLTKKERRALKVNSLSDVKPNTATFSSNIQPLTQQLNSTKSNIHIHTCRPVDPSVNKIQTENIDFKFTQNNLKPSTVSSETQKLNVVQNEKKRPETILNHNTKVENVSAGLSKAELRAQRRAVQEAQRVAKANQNVKTPNKDLEVKIKQNDKPLTNRSPKAKVIKPPSTHKVQLFNHLYVEDPIIRNLKDYTLNKEGVHPAFLRLGSQYLSKTILGSNARCLAMLSAFKYLIHDFKTPPKQEFYRSLESTLQTCITHLHNCRPLAVSMTNALRHFKLFLTQTNDKTSDNDKRNLLQERVDNYIQEQIGKAGEAISNEVNKKILDNDVILIYGYSSLIKRILIDAHKDGKKFRVIVLDSRPLLEGREMLRCLVCADIQCSYLLINAVSFVMSRVTKVLLGAHALLANGYVMSRTGTAQVALVANAYKKPVLVCCETYKFCERAQTDSFVYNEIADPDQLITVESSEKSSCLVNWRNNSYLTPLNIMYDVTPSDFVTAVVTEVAVLPCTSVPVILRIKPVE